MYVGFVIYSFVLFGNHISLRKRERERERERAGCFTLIVHAFIYGRTFEQAVLFAVRIISYYCTDRSNKKLVTKCGARQHFKQRAYVSEFI